MFNPLLNIVLEYGGAVLVGIVTGLICRGYFASRVRQKIKDYQSQIVRCHARILELESSNDKLEKRLQEFEKNFSKDKLFMN